MKIKQIKLDKNYYSIKHLEKEYYIDNITEYENCLFCLLHYYNI